MKASVQKSPSNAETHAGALKQKPALAAYHVIRDPKDTPPILRPIGAAFAHSDGKGLTLDLTLMPTAGGRILLRAPKEKNPA